MKKILAIFVVFTLIATAAFAQISAGGGLTATLVSGDSDAEDAKGLSSGFESGWSITASKTNEENTAGAKASISFSMHNNGTQTDFDMYGGSYFMAWWQPIPQFFIKAGKVGEEGKYWTGADVVGWGFQSNDLKISPAFDYYNGFAGNVLSSDHGFMGRPVMDDFNGLQISILPIDGLAINLGWGLGKVFDDTYSQIAAQVVYNIDGVGEAAVGFVNEGEEEDKHLYVQWNMPIDTMKFEIGAHFAFNPDDKDANGDVNKKPIDIGLGFRYGNQWGDPFWLSARVGLSIGTADKSASVIGFDVCPSIDVGAFRLYTPVGIGLVVQEDQDALFAWSLNPYIRKQMGGVEFWIGLKLYNGDATPGGIDSTNSDKVNWAIPFAITVGF